MTRFLKFNTKTKNKKGEHWKIAVYQMMLFSIKICKRGCYKYLYRFRRIYAQHLFISNLFWSIYIHILCNPYLTTDTSVYYYKLINTIKYWYVRFAVRYFERDKYVYRIQLIISVDYLSLCCNILQLCILAILLNKILYIRVKDKYNCMIRETSE